MPGAEGRTEILRMTLAAGADLKSTNRYGGTALIPAAHHGHPEAVRILLAHRDRQGSRQQARLDRAARSRDPRRRRAGAYRDRAAAGRGRRERQSGGPRGRDAAAARQAARVSPEWCGFWRPRRASNLAYPVLIQRAQSSRPLSAARWRRRHPNHRRRCGTNRHGSVAFAVRARRSAHAARPSRSHAAPARRRYRRAGRRCRD